ncbi:alpha/beta fold hydrolase [Actinocorallia populi]|uniref:alpha/beta fold hydrolase n=1 Tax=Actinocorallia populi TaxID=2079200 RepID=UPI001300A060|nr:alpha/beta fold hydrolase [Actinocorallia populi]
MLRFPPLAIPVAAACALAVVPSASASAAPARRTVELASFDGVEIVTHFFRAPGLRKGERRPVVLLGTGWAGRGETDPKAEDGQLGPLLRAGYNVVTWNPRGFGSGGAAHVDDPRVEGRDMRRIINWVARQKEVRLDRKGDPRLGMAGGSYGGAIQLVTAGLDRRVDAIVPSIAFNDLAETLYPDEVFRAGWGAMLCSGGFLNGNKLAPQVQKGCLTGLASGRLPDDTYRWFREHGPDHLVRRISVPTLVLQGTVDTLFPLRQGIEVHRAVKANRAPVKMIWFCGGHGSCDTDPGPAKKLTKATVAWFDRYLKGDRRVRTGPGFEYIDQHGVYRSAPSYPMKALGELRAQASGRLEFSRRDADIYLKEKKKKSGNGIPEYMVAARPQAKAVDVALPAVQAPAQTVGTPRVTLRYRGTANKPRTALYAQLVDRGTGLVVGNQATPLPVVLDGRERTVTRDLEAVAWSLTPASRLELQIVPITGLFDWQRSAGRVELTADVALPLVEPGPRS